MPDEVPRPVPKHLRGEARDPDVLDHAQEFRAAFGAWPRTWLEFNHGLAHLARASAAEKLRMADAVAAHKQKEEDWRGWQMDQRDLAGF